MKKRICLKGVIQMKIRISISIKVKFDSAQPEPAGEP